MPDNELCSESTERAVLGAAFLDNTALRRSLDLLSVDDFALSSRREIFAQPTPKLLIFVSTSAFELRALRGDDLPLGAPALRYRFGPSASIA